MKTLPSSVDLTRCCPEAQCDGVPCPTLGRSCETCERAMAVSRESGPTLKAS
jgi:hypothetical protein